MLFEILTNKVLRCHEEKNTDSVDTLEKSQSYTIIQIALHILVIPRNIVITDALPSYCIFQTIQIWPLL